MKRKGFTLVELILVLSIFTLLMGCILSVLGVELDFWGKIVAASEKQQISNIVMSRIISDIRAANEILPGSDQNKLLLKSSSNIIEYSLKNSKVRRKKNNYSAYLTDKGDLQTLSFQYPASKMVAVMVENLSSEAYLRN